MVVTPAGSDSVTHPLCLPFEGLAVAK